MQNFFIVMFHPQVIGTSLEIDFQTPHNRLLWDIIRVKNKNS